MAALQLHLYFLHSAHTPKGPKLLHFKNPVSLSYSRKLLFHKRISGFLDSSYFRANSVNGPHLLCCFSKGNAENETLLAKEQESESENERPPFDINLAVILAGFAFEAYYTPPVKFSALSILFMCLVVIVPLIVVRMNQMGSVNVVRASNSNVVRKNLSF